MGVYCDKVIGYSLDITEEWDKLSEDVKDKWLEENNSKLNYISYYDRNESLKDYVTVIYDGMNGDYCKIVYVICCSKNAEEENDDELVDCINSLLKESPVPFSVKQDIRNVYKELLGRDLSRTSDIKPNYIVHWH
ncbi:MAG: hypothetical protein J6A59_15015 [Lachnospiraceae bacterium]|nr:hypothetical protein [Lachnospiraceae bacterium]